MGPRAWPAWRRRAEPPPARCQLRLAGGDLRHRLPAARLAAQPDAGPARGIRETGVRLRAVDRGIATCRRQRPAVRGVAWRLAGRLVLRRPRARARRGRARGPWGAD